MKRCLAGLVVAVIFLAAVPGAASAPAGPRSAPEVASTPLAEPGRTVTLLTGDRVVVGRSGDSEALSFLPAAGRPPHGYVITRLNGRTLVVPQDVATLVPRVLDPALFDVGTLLSEQGDDTASTDIPVIWRQGPRTHRSDLAGAAHDRRSLPSIRADSVRVPKSEAEDFGAALVAARADEGALPRQVWLDRRVRPAVDENLTQVGAPAMWAKGGDGSGTMIAVLDTGVDAAHPDLAGKVVASKNFTAWPDPDRLGHGTHVASILAGSGAAAEGERRGVAHGAEILSAKVLGDDNFGWMSDVIAGVEWAAEQDADVANLSIVSDDDSDGSDPLSQAINVATRESGTLFVVAAGNRAVPGSIGSPAAAEDALTVGAVDSADDLASFSSRGPRPGGGIKPEITAPGVDIIAALSTQAGGSLDQQYIAQSGTSMATPHVAGAAAVLLQGHPTWMPSQLRAALVATAQENPSYTVHDQGGGRLYLPDADAAAVLPETHALDFGLLGYPQDDRTETRDLTWHNYGRSAVTLDLSITGALPSGTVSLDPSTLTIAAGTTGSSTVAVRAGSKDEGPAPGLHGGEVVATPRGSTGAVVGVPFAFDKEPERYELQVTVLSRSGKPAPSSLLTVLNVDDFALSPEYVGLDSTGTATVRVSPGTYHAEALVDLYGSDEGGAADIVRAVLPQFEVRGPTTAVLDARHARQVNVAVAGQPTEQVYLQHQERRTDALGNEAYLGASSYGPLQTLSATPTEPVTVGTLDTYLSGRVAAPQLRFNGFTGPPAIRVWGAPQFVGDRRLRVVDVGEGTAADFAAVRVRGAVALVTTRGHPPTATLAAADSARAALVVLANDTDTPWQTYLDQDASTPAVTVTSSLGAALAASPRAVRVRGTVIADPTYDVVYPSNGRFPETNRHELSPADVVAMARVSTAVAAVPSGDSARYGVGRAPVVAGFDISSAAVLPHQPGVRRSEYVQAGSWLSTAYRADEASFVTLEDPIRTEPPGSTRTETWFGAPWRPLSEQVTRFGTAEAAYRDAENLYLGLPPLADADGHVESSLPFNEAGATYTVSSGGQELGTAPGPFAIVPVPSDVTDLEVRYDVDTGPLLASQGRSRTVWQLSTPAPTAEPRPLPVLEVDLQLPVGLGEVLTGRTAQLSVTRPFGPAVTLRQVTVEVSTNGGSNWRPASIRRDDASTADIRLPRVPKGKPVTIRVTAVDAGGDSVTQTLYAAAIGG